MPRDFTAGRAFDGQAPLSGNTSILSDVVADGLGRDANNSGDGGEIAEQIAGTLQGGNLSIHDCRNTNRVASCQQRKLQGEEAKELVVSQPMRGIGDRVKARRQQLGLSTPELARRVGGISYQAIQALEAGGNTKHLVRIAKALGVTPEWLQDGSGPSPKSPQIVNEILMQTLAASDDGLSIKPIPVQHQRSQELLEVRGMAEGGPDGWAPFNGDVVAYVAMPENLKGVINAYAVFVRGDSMAPRYEVGMTVHIHPSKPVEPGAYVLVQRKPRHEGEAPLAVLKRLVRRSATKVVLAQLNPPKEIDVPTSEIVSIHRVVGSSEA